MLGCGEDSFAAQTESCAAKRLRSCSLKISSPDLSGFNQIGAARGIGSVSFAGLPLFFVHMH